MTAITAENSGGASGTAFHDVVVEGASTLLAVTTPVVHGAVAAAFTPAASSRVYAAWDATGQNDLYGRLYLQLTGLPVSGSPLALLRVVDAAGLTLAGVNILASGVVQLYQGNGSAGGASVLAGTVPCVTGSPMRLEWHMTLGSVVGLVETRLFLSAESTTPSESLSSAANTSGTPAQYRTGMCLARSSPPATFYIDDLVWGVTDWPGPSGTPPPPPPPPPPPDTSLTYPGAPTNWTTAGTDVPGSGTTTFTTRASSIMGAGFQNAGCWAPPGLGHQWLCATGGDVMGCHVSVDGTNWVTSNTGLSETSFRIAAIEGSRTVANRLWAYSSSAAGAGRLWRGTFRPGSGTVTWTLIGSHSSGPDAGGSTHPRQTGRQIALDEAGGYAYLGATNGVVRINLATTAAANIGGGLTGAVVGLVLDPGDPTICYAVCESGVPGVWRLTGIRGTASGTRDTTLTSPQDLCLSGDGTTLYVAGMAQGVRRWAVSGSITSGWTNITNNLDLSSHGVSAIAASADTAGKLVVSFAGQNITTNGFATSTNNGVSWTNQSGGGFTITDVPWGETASFWLTAADPYYRIDENGWDCTTVRFQPGNDTVVHAHGRSAVWRGNGTTWRPSIRGLCATNGWACVVDPRPGAAGGMGLDGDWGPIRFDAKATDMPVRVDPNGNKGTGMGGMYRADSGKVAVSMGDWSASTNGEVHTNPNPHGGGTWTDEGFSAGGVQNRCGVAIGENAGGSQVLLTLKDGAGIQRKVGTGTPTTVEPGVTNGFYSLAKFCWPDGHTGTQPYVFLSAANGLWRSVDYGANWTHLFTYTNSSEYTGELCGLPGTVGTLFVTTSSGPAGAGLYRIAGATGASPTMTRIGPAAAAPGPCATDPGGFVYFAVTANQTGGAKLYKSADPNPGASTSFTDLTDERWAAGVTFPGSMQLWDDGTILVANKGMGGYFVGSQTGVSGGGYQGCCNSASTTASGGVVHDYGGTAGCNTAGGAPFTPAGTYSQWGLAGSWRRMEYKLRIDDDDPAEGHFWAMRTKFQGTTEACYFGLQRNGIPPTGPPTKLALFSVWGAVGAVAGDATGAAGEPFVEGTSGWRVLAPYDWTLGAVYTLRVQADEARGLDWWRLEVVADTTGTVTWIGSVQVPSSWGDLEAAAVVAFTEWFTNEGGLTSCLQIPRVTGFFGTPGFSPVTVVGGGGTGGGGGGTGTGVAQPLLLALHRPQATDIPATTPPLIDASSPASVRSGNTFAVRTTASFTPPTGSLVVAIAANNTQAGVVRDRTISDSAGGTWTQRAYVNDLGGTDGPGVRGQMSMWTRNTPGAGTAMTVTDTIDTAEGGWLKVLVLVDANVTAPTGDTASASGLATAAGVSVTTQYDHSLVIGAVTEWNLTAVGTAGPGCTVQDGAVGPNITSYVLRRAAETSPAGAAPLTTTAPAAGTEWNAVAVEFRGIPAVTVDNDLYYDRYDAY